MDVALKQRLVGASVLVALAVIVLPMLLGGRPGGEGEETRKIQVPAPPSELDLQTRKFPVGDASRPASEPAKEAHERQLPEPSGSPPATTEQSAAPMPAAPRPEAHAPETVQAPAQAVERVQEAEEEGAAASPAAGAGGRYVVQVASFSSASNAERLSGTLRQYGYTPMVDRVRSDVGTLHRVRIGPYSTEAEAGQAVARLKDQVGDVKPRIMDLQPEEAAQVTRPADPLVRWVVQVGSFSNRANAEKLVGQIRKEGLAAYFEEVASSGRTLYRVRAGPFLERDGATAAASQINQRLGVKGVVMTTG